MKVTVEVDCTPEEARRFLGLPDLQPMQEAVLAKVQQQMLDGVAAVSPEALMMSPNPVSSSTGTPGLRCLISRASFSPSSFGIVRSVRTMSNSAAQNFSSPSAPSSASSTV